MSSYPVASLDDGVKVRTVDIDVADATTMEEVCSSYNTGISPFEDSVAEPPAGMARPYLLRLTSACSWDGSGSASLVVEDGQENVIFNSSTSPSTVFSEAAEISVEELAYARFVDMGLPSGLLWATCNIDASKPAGMGETEFTYYCSFFSWGNTVAHNPSGEGSSARFDYVWGTVNGQAPWYEGQPYGSTSGNELNSDITLANDAARVVCGEPWRMPSSSEFNELLANVDYLNADGTVMPDGTTDKRITLGGVVGIWMQSKINGNRLFFACAGVGSGNAAWASRGVSSYCWSASFRSDREAVCLSIGADRVYVRYMNRCYGFPIRPVRERSRRRQSENESEQRQKISENESKQLQKVSENESGKRQEVSENKSKGRKKK